ncbi:ABC transporter ATP-binding protein [Haliea sp.]
MSDPASRAAVLRLSAVSKTYHIATPQEHEVLHGIDLRLESGELAALVGPSGSGKSTLLNLIGLLDTPTSGELYLLEHPTQTMDDAGRTRLRNEAIGFVFQFHHLIPAFSVLENVLMPLILRHGKPGADDIEQAQSLLADVGLAGFGAKKPSQISGGEQQRVAIARALVTRPALLLADEPTGNLDTQSADRIFELFRQVNSRFQCAVLIVTHDNRLAARCSRIMSLVDGRFHSSASASHRP